MKNKYRIGLLFSFLMIIGCNDVGRYQIFYDSDAFKTHPKLFLIDTKTGDLYRQKQITPLKFRNVPEQYIEVDKWILIETLDDKLVKEIPKEISE